MIGSSELKLSLPHFCVQVLIFFCLLSGPPCRSQSLRWLPKDSESLLQASQEQAQPQPKAQEQSPATTPDAVIHSVVDAIAKNYLRARANPLWNLTRDKLLAGKYKNSTEAFQAVRDQLPNMEDSELNLLTPSEVEEVQSVALGQKVGLGLADFCIDMQIETGRARVVTPIAGSPAMKAGIQPGDVILSVNGKATSELSHEQFMDTLSSATPGGLKLQIERGENTVTAVVQPSSEKLEALQSMVKRVSGKSIGYIRPVLFTPDLPQKARAAVTKMEQEVVVGYILDLRNNPGGFLNSARDLAGVFVTGKLGYALRSNGVKQPIEVGGEPLTKKPLVVLINGGTASASELLAGALQGLHRGVLVGSITYGRGQAQIFVPLAEGYGIQIPSVQLLTPDEREFKGKGIAPDIEIEQPQLQESQVAGQKDQQFMRAVKELTTH